MRRYLLLVGGAAGTTDQEAVGRAHQVLAAEGATEVTWVSEPPELQAALDALDGRTLVIAGGDGTLHVVMGALDERDALAEVTVGLIPLGTGNDLARGLGLPLDPGAAAKVVAEGRPHAIDLIRTDDHVVMNAAHAGIGVTAAEHAATLKDLAPEGLGTVAYRVGAVTAGLRPDSLDLRVEVDGVPLGDGAALLLVGVGNGPTIGGGTRLFPDADPTDGQLEVIAVDDLGVWERLELGLAARRGDHLDMDGVHMLRGHEVVVRGVAAWNDDGELRPPRDDRTLRIDPAAWHLLR